MGRERKEFVRPEGYKDASLIVIAMEGTETEFQYFTGLKNNYKTKKIMDLH